jgi:hypothetical protein
MIKVCVVWCRVSRALCSPSEFALVELIFATVAKLHESMEYIDVAVNKYQAIEYAY